MLIIVDFYSNDSVVVFRNQWQKIVTQLEPKPADNILSEYFAASIVANTGNFYDSCLDQDINRDDFLVFTQKLTKLCQARKDRRGLMLRAPGVETTLAVHLAIRQRSKV